MDKISIIGDFGNEELDQDLGFSTSQDRKKLKKVVPKHQIPEHPGFEIVKLPNESLAKLAYKKLYPADEADLDIELHNITKYEVLRKSQNFSVRKQAKINLKFHYKKAVSIIAPHIAAGWNRWSEYILELFIQEKAHHVLWGSGNCGKSAVMAVLLYTKWRAKPNERMVVIATKIVAEADARVFAYIKEIHAGAPPSRYHEFTLVDSSKTKAIYCLLRDDKENKTIADDRACIISLPLKTKNSASGSEVGANLMGKHPKDCLILCFDECQELSASLLQDRIFANWYTNANYEIHAWGNPVPVDLDMPDEHDMLFKLGSSGLSRKILKEKCKEENAKTCSMWGWEDTHVLHLTMMDSPKDDPDEVAYKIIGAEGFEISRLHFLAGLDNVQIIAKRVPKKSPAWYSQVLGIPFLVSNSSNQQGVITSFIAKEASLYPLIWSQRNPKGEFFMGVDPSGSGKNDGASISIVRYGEMQDGRFGIDCMKGEGNTNLYRTDEGEISDLVIEKMWERAQHYKIPLRNISIETHGVGEVFRYAFQRHLEDKLNPKWSKDVSAGQNFFTVNPTISPTDRPLFKLLGHPRPAKEIVSNITTEYWLALRCLFLTRQIFNVPEIILQQLYSRSLITTGSTNKYTLESKEKMRARGLDSPNDTDALVNCIELIRHRGFKYVYANTGHYKEFYGEEFKKKEEHYTASKAMNIVSNLLQLGQNFGPQPKKRKRLPEIDCI
jgi:hypothetical protein